MKNLEKAGSLVRVQEQMENDAHLKARLEVAHHSIPALRSHLIPREWISKLRTWTPEDFQAANLSPKAPMIIFETGLIGISLTKAAEVKCLHAHLADYLMRGDVNPIGLLVVEDLAGVGVDVSGTNHCWRECALQEEEKC